MNYPNKKKSMNSSFSSYKNRGMFLEDIINLTNSYNRDEGIALVYKKHTPIGVTSVEKSSLKGFFKSPSTLDYVGLYKSHYLEFDAKECKSKTSFPLSNIRSNQLEHIKKVLDHGGISFLIIYICCEYYLLFGRDLLKFISKNDRKSIPTSFIKEVAHKLNYNYLRGIDYIEVIDKYLEEL